jgi:hypothetical protein
MPVTFASIGQGFNAIDQLSSGNIMGGLSSVTQMLGFGSLAPVTLGSFVFSQFEVPEQIRFGTKQKTNVHVRPGGMRQVDVLGPDPEAISWSGILLGPGADHRALQLDSLLKKGDAQTLAWGSYSYQVIIESVSFEYRRDAWLSYQIACLILGPTQQRSSGGLLSSVMSDLGNALGIDLPGTLSSISQGLGQISPLLQGLSSLTGGSPIAGRILGVVSGIQGLTSSLGSTNAANITTLSQAASNFTSSTTVSSVTSTLSSLGDAVSQAPLVQSVSNLAGRMARNLVNPSAT